MWAGLATPVTAAKVAAAITRAVIGEKFYPQTAGEASASVTPTDYAYPEGDLYRYGATGDGTTDDSAAITAAASIGCPLWAGAGTFYCSNVVLLNNLDGPGTLKCVTGTSGHWISTGAAGVTVDGVTLDCNLVGVAGEAGLAVLHDDVTIGRRVLVKNSYNEGIRVSDANNARIFARVKDCRQIHVYALCINQDIEGLEIDAHCDGTALGVNQFNGGIKVHGNATYKVIRPIVRGFVKLAENAAMPANAVCFETHTNCVAPLIDGTALGGSIGCTMQNSPNGTARVIAIGQNNLGCEIAEGSPGARFVASQGIPGDVVSPITGAQASGSDNVSFDGYFEGSTYGCYLESLTGAALTGHYLAGAALFRFRGASDIRVIGARGIGDTCAQIFTLDTASGAVGNIQVIGGHFTGCAGVFHSTGVIDGLRVSGGAIIENTVYALCIGGGTFTGVSLTPDCDLALNTAAGGSGRDTRIGYISYSTTPGNALLEMWGNGTPEGYMSAAIGSVYHREDGGAGSTVYYKETAPTAYTGWVAK